MLAMVIYAVKCDYPKKDLKKDLNAIYERLKDVKHSNDLCLNDVKSALEAYDDTLATYPRYDIERKTGIRIDANKRNYRKQSVHLEIARRIQEVIQPNWRNGNGRKSKKT